MLLTPWVVIFCNSSFFPLLFLKNSDVYLTFYLIFLIVTVEFYMLHFPPENVCSIFTKDTFILPHAWKAHAASQSIFDKQANKKIKFSLCTRT